MQAGEGWGTAAGAAVGAGADMGRVVGRGAQPGGAGAAGTGSGEGAEAGRFAMQPSLQFVCEMHGKEQACRQRLLRCSPSFLSGPAVIHGDSKRETRGRV